MYKYNFNNPIKNKNRLISEGTFIAVQISDNMIDQLLMLPIYTLL